MVDLVRNIWRQLSERVVGQFSHVDDRIHSIEIFGFHLAKIFRDCERHLPATLVKGALSVEPGIQTDNVKSSFKQFWSQ